MMLNLSVGSGIGIAVFLITVSTFIFKYFPNKKDEVSKEVVEVMRSFADVSQRQNFIFERMEKTIDGSHTKLNTLTTLTQGMATSTNDINRKMDKANESLIKIEANKGG